MLCPYCVVYLPENSCKPNNLEIAGNNLLPASTSEAIAGKLFYI
ncbi:hypothetical protein [Nostoc sp. CHAB 5715]|nr:hypothetical protein [Nostoc sp. CHAB 5715]